MSREAVLSLYLPAMILALGTGIATPAIPIYAKSFDISFGTASLVLIVHAAGMVASTLPSGYLIDKVGRKPVLLAGPVLTAVTAVLTAFAGSFPELLLYRAINGAASQMWNQARIAMIADQGGDRERGKLITWMMSMQRFAHLFSPALGGFLAAIDIRLPFLVHGALIVIALIPSLKYVKETAPDRIGGRKPRPEAGEWSYVFGLMRQPQIAFFMAAQLLANLTRGGAGGVINLYMVYQYGIGPEALGLIGTLNSLVVLPIGFATGYIMDRWGRKKTIIPGFTGLCLSALFMAATALLGSPLWVFLVAYLLQHISQGTTGGNMQVLGSDLAPSRARGRFMAMWRMIGEGGNLANPIMFTWLAVSISYAAAFSFIGLSALGVVLIIGFKVKETVGSRKAEKGPPAAEPAPELAASATASSPGEGVGS
jgi:MFS family permease